MSRVMPEPWERVRMAFAEVGVDPSLVSPPTDPRLSFMLPGWVDVDVDVRWRARECALCAEPICRACFDRAAEVSDTGAKYRVTVECVSTRRFEQDCGVSR